MLDWRFIDLYLHLAFLDDKEHACGSPLLKNVVSGLSLVGIHGVGKFLSFVFAQFEEQKMFADGLFDELQVLGGFGSIYFFYVLIDLLCGAPAVESFELVLLFFWVLWLLRGEVDVGLAEFDDLGFLTAHKSSKIFSNLLYRMNSGEYKCFWVLVYREISKNSCEFTSWNRIAWEKRRFLLEHDYFLQFFF